MSSAILHVDATVNCSHQGQAQPQAPFERVKVSGKQVITILSPYAVSNCSLSTTSSPPCAIGLFTKGAQKVFAGGLPVALLDSESTCIPTAAPLKPSGGQTRVVAT
jgi:hypothetical protein